MMRPIAIAAAFVVAIGSAVFTQSAAPWRENVADSHLFAYYGWRVAQGAVPYLDVWDNKPPGVWWVNALAFHVFGEGIRRELAAAGMAVAVAILALAGAAGAAYGRAGWWLGLSAGAVLLTLRHYECGANRTETFVVACETAAVFAYARWLRCGGTAPFRSRLVRGGGWLLLAGMSAGAAPWFKQSGLAALAACGAHLVFVTILRWRDAHAGNALVDTAARRAALMRPWIWALAGVACVQLAGIGVLAAQGALGAAYEAVIGFNAATLAQIGGASPLRSLWTHGYAMLAPLAVFGAWAVVSGVFRARAGMRGESSRGDLFDVALMWLAAALLLAAAGGGHQAYHYQPILPPLALLSVDWLGRIARSQGLLKALAARPTLAAATAAWGLSLCGLLPGSVEEARRCWSQKPSWYASERRAAAPWEAQAAYIRRHTRADETIYVWGWSPGTYRYAYRACPSRFATIEKVTHVGPLAEFIVRGAIEDVQASPPALFVVSTGDYAGLAGGSAGAFGGWLSENYEEAAEIQGMRILRRLARD